MWVLWTMLQRGQEALDEEGRDRGTGEIVERLTVGLEGEREAAIGGVLVPVEAVAEDIPSRRERVIRWLNRHYIYCEVTGAPQSNRLDIQWLETRDKIRGTKGT
ncbi:hypothetical protein BKA61DRAFT_581227 [Leptodontidium sp. MPI-SDFR-AT-0119]|nr:hypothetical protein BKA61DRAFT_581227 [Leptodontidium sp. MPI-SDFR-AT-0119]